MTDPVAITISTLALVISATTAWLTLFRRGTVKMTQPTVIFLGPDMPTSRDDGLLPKIYLRTLLFSQTLEITRDLASRLEEPGAGLYFDWGADSSRYIPHVEKRLPSTDAREFLEALTLTQRAPAPVDKQSIA